MKRVCAWCNKPMTPSKNSNKVSATMVTHSICHDCSDNLDFQLGVSLTTYLDSLKIPIIALDNKGSLLAINRFAKEIYKGNSSILPEEWPEKVFECAHARLPEGCKTAVHCSGCAIRFTTAETFTTGNSRHDMPAHLNHCSSDMAEKAELLVSADKIDGIVFLRIVRL